MTDVPTYPNTAVGFRQWQVNADGWLFGTGYSHLWRPGVNYAVCGSLELHLSPGEGCDCGFYAFAEPTDFKSGDLLSGVIVANGGLMTERLGFRAEQAMIVALAIPPSHKGEVALAQQAADRYGVPLIDFEDLELVAGRYGVVPRMVNPPPDSLTDQEFKERQRLSEQRRFNLDVAALTLVPEGSLLDVGIKPDVTRLRSIVLLAARQPNGTTKDEVMRTHWPTLAAGVTDLDTAEYKARYLIGERLASAFTYLRTARLIVGEKLPTGSVAKLWRSTADGDAVCGGGAYRHEPHEADIRARREASGREQSTQNEGVQLALPPPGPLLPLGTLPRINRYRTIIVAEALAAGEAGVTREAIQAKYWPALPIHCPKRGDISKPPDAQVKGYYLLLDVLDRTIHYLKKHGYIVGELRTDGGFGKVWRATDKAKQLQFVDEYIPPNLV